MNDCTLVIMAKAPNPGRVKTRLAECLPVASIPELYRCLLNDTIELAQSLKGVETAIMSPAADVEELSRIAGGGMTVVGQNGTGLGAALSSVFTHFTAPGRRRIVAFNSDSPHLPASALRAAFEALNSYELVIGATHDGGYYLVGATASYPGLFSSDTLGTASALEALLERARVLAVSVCFTETFYDVDVQADLSRLTEELRSRPEQAPRTAKWLCQWPGTASSQQAKGENG